MPLDPNKEAQLIKIFDHAMLGLESDRIEFLEENRALIKNLDEQSLSEKKRVINPLGCPFARFKLIIMFRLALDV